MSDPRQGRAGAGGHSPRLGSRDPRVRGNAAGLVNDADLDPGTLERDGAGRTRFKGFDGIPPLAAGASLAEVVAKVNQMLARSRS